ncbi:MAG: hypothetical protein JKX81_19585 [Arenicella sp.]|nr:hypothetical protein [Arenicella sp.]
MLRFFAFLFLLVIAIAGYAWYSAQSLPKWYSQKSSQQDQAAKALSQEIEKQGVSKFLGNKVEQILNGKVTFNEVEFNAIMLASLKSDEDGQKLLAVSDAVKAFINKDQLELSVIINLDKVEKINPKARKAIEKLDRIFPFLNDSRVAVTVYGTPIVRNGNLAIKDDFHIKVGAIPISNSSLRQLGAKVERANTTDLPLKYLSISKITLIDGQVELAVLPRF